MPTSEDDDAAVIGEGALALVLIAGVAAWVLWAALFGCWQDFLFEDGVHIKTTTTTMTVETPSGGTSTTATTTCVTEIAATSPTSTATSLGALVTRGRVAALGHALGFWLPVGGIVQHGMVQVGF